MYAPVSPTQKRHINFQDSFSAKTQIKLATILNTMSGIYVINLDFIQTGMTAFAMWPGETLTTETTL
jgi:hypothetical protein